MTSNPFNRGARRFRPQYARLAPFSAKDRYYGQLTRIERELSKHGYLIPLANLIQNANDAYAKKEA